VPERFPQVVLADANIGRKLSMSAQHLAGVPARQFISMIAETRAKILAGGAAGRGSSVRLPLPSGPRSARKARTPVAEN
jgi:hypothetical protein